MTFCLGIHVHDGLIGIADTRIVSGNEFQVARKTYRHSWHRRYYMGMATKTLLTLEEFERLPDEPLYELSEGELIALVYPKLRHSLIADTIQQRIREAGPDGKVLIEALYLLSEEPPTLRRPDVSFLSAKRVAQTPEDDWVRGSPELAVEIVSPSQSAQDLDEKTHQYLRAGALAVWVVYPKTRTVHVHTPGRDPVVKDENGVLALPEIFPNWSLKVSDIF